MTLARTLSALRSALFESLTEKPESAGTANPVPVSQPVAAMQEERPRRARRRQEPAWQDEEEQPRRRKAAVGEHLWILGAAGGALAALLLGVLVLVFVLARTAPDPVAVAPNGTEAPSHELWQPDRDVKPPPPPVKNQAPPPVPAKQPEAPPVNEAAPAPVKREGTKIYLTDLKESHLKGGMSWLGRQGKLPNGRPASVSGRPTPKGVTQHPLGASPPEWVASVKYTLGGRATAFQTWAAVDDSSNPPPSYEYAVLGDDRVLWRSTIIARGKPEEIVLNLRGVQVLELRVAARPFYAVWVDPCIWVKEP
jgi:hypothetical protein